MELKKKEYGEYVEKITPKNSLPADMARAFLTGGAICSLGQAMIMGLMSLGGLEKETAQTWTQLALIFLSILLTGLNLYPKAAKWGRCRGPGTDYRLCQFCCGSSHRIQGRRPCIWYWLQDFYHCRAGDFVWDICQLDPGADCLDRGLVRREAHAEGKS